MSTERKLRDKINYKLLGTFKQQLNVQKKDLKLAGIILSSYLCLHIILERHKLWAWDIYTYMSFAQHFSEHWFSTIVPGQALGIQTLSYPPLLFQVMALLLNIPGVNPTSLYILAMSLGVTALSFSFYYMLSAITGLDTFKKYIILLTAFSPGLIKFSLVHGQLTYIYGLTFAFTSVGLIYHILSGKDYGKLLIITTVLTAYIHHFSFLTMTLILFLVFLLNIEKFMSRIGYFIPIYAISGLLIAMGLLPSLYEMFFGVTQGTIYHGSRNPLESVRVFNQFISSTYGYALIAIPLLIRERLSSFDLNLMTAIFLTLGLGLVTPLPELLFQGLAHVLIYDRFSLIAGLFLTALIGRYLLHSAEKLEKASTAKIIIVVLLVSGGVANAFWSNDIFHGSYTGYGHTNQSERQAAVDYLNENASKEFLYATRGYGPGVDEIRRNTDIPTLDTAYYSGRNVDVLNSFAKIDGLKAEEFQKVIENADKLSLKYIFSFDRPTDKIMENTTWEKKDLNNSVKVWINEDAEKYEGSLGKNRYIYGIMPLTVFFLLLTAYFSKRVSKALESQLVYIEKQIDKIVSNISISPQEIEEEKQYNN